MLTLDCRENMIAFLYSFDLFKGPLIIPVRCNDIKHISSKSIDIIVNIDLESMQIIVFSDTSSVAAV